MSESLASLAPRSMEIFYFACGLFLLILALVLFVIKVPSDKTTRFLSWLFATTMCIAPLLALPVFPYYDREIAMLGALIGGISLGWCYLQCVSVYSKLEREQVVIYVLISYLLGSVIRVPLEVLPISFTAVLVSPLPFVCLIMCRSALRYIQERAVSDEHASPQSLTVEASSASIADVQSEVVQQDPEQSEESRSFAGLFPVAIEVMAYGLALGMTYLGGASRFEPPIMVAHLIFRMLFPLTILWLIASKSRVVSVSLFLQCAFLFVITALVAIPLFGEAGTTVVATVSACARTAIIILVWLMLALFARGSKRHPAIIFGFGWAMYTLSVAIGTTFADIMGGLSDTFLLGVIYLLVISTVFVLNFRGAVTTQLFFNKNFGEEKILSDFETIDTRCQALGEEKGLTQREVEIMRHICKGRSKSYIAQTLLLSENTIRSYSKNLYLKLGVHSRQQLLDLIGIS
jgi:DNA-binding CsgD family transcriptional regulator